MKTFKIDKKISKQAKHSLQSIINTHEKYSKSYFFSPSQNASGRRSNEKNFLKNNPEVHFITSKGLLKVSFNYSESCQNVYYKIYITLDDVPKNISFIKKLVN